MGVSSIYQSISCQVNKSVLCLLICAIVGFWIFSDPELSFNVVKSMCLVMSVSAGMSVPPK